MHGIFSTDTVNKCQQLLNTTGKIIITTHKSPDGDAIGSSLGLLNLLKNMGKDAYVILPDAAPEFLKWPSGYEDCIIFQTQTEQAKTLLSEAVLIFSLDYNNFSRTGSDMEAVLRDATAPSVMIDHHHNPDNVFAIQFSDTDICSTCQLLYEWTSAMGLLDHLDQRVAECFYLGIMTDSGSFRFPSVTPKTHLIIAHLMNAGIDHAAIHRNVYDNNLLNRLRLIGYALSEKLEVIQECGTALISLNKEELDRYGYQPGDTEGLVNQALSLQGINLAAFFREGNNEIKVSLRSTGTFDVNQFARRSWNGGGHKNAAGGSSQESLPVSLERFRKEALDLKNEIIAS